MLICVGNRNREFDGLRKETLIPSFFRGWLNDSVDIISFFLQCCPYPRTPMQRSSILMFPISSNKDSVVQIVFISNSGQPIFQPWISPLLIFWKYHSQKKTPSMLQWKQREIRLFVLMRVCSNSLNPSGAYSRVSWLRCSPPSILVPISMQDFYSPLYLLFQKPKVLPF